MSGELRPAKPPFSIHPYYAWVVLDSDGIAVLSCSDIAPTCSLWKDDPLPGCVECPKCNRMLTRMDFATPQQCGIEVKP